MSRRLALEALKVTEANIRSQWACSGHEVYKPFQTWLAVVREAIDALEASQRPRRYPVRYGPQMVQAAKRQKR